MLQSVGTEAFKEAIDNPAVNVLVAAIEGWRGRVVSRWPEKNRSPHCLVARLFGEIKSRTKNRGSGFFSRYNETALGWRLSFTQKSP